LTKRWFCLDTDKLSDAALDDRLEVLYRENVRLSEVIQHSIEGKSDEVNLLDNIRILHALRESVNEEVISQDLGHTHRSGSTTGGPKHRATSLAKRKFNASTPSGEDIDDSSHSITHSPRGPRLNTSSRDKSLRAGSATPSFREASVKLEDGDSEISSLDGVDHEGMDLSELGSAAGTTGVRNNIPTSSVNSMANVGQAGSSTPLNGQRQFLAEGSFVLYRTKGRPQDGEGMVCRVTSVIGDGKQRRYEIQDTEPDPRNGTGIQQPYRASVNHLIPIPENNFGLSDLAKGKNVLAQYPVHVPVIRQSRLVLLTLLYRIQLPFTKQKSLLLGKPKI